VRHDTVQLELKLVVQDAFDQLLLLLLPLCGLDLLTRLPVECTQGDPVRLTQTGRYTPVAEDAVGQLLEFVEFRVNNGFE